MLFLFLRRQNRQRQNAYTRNKSHQKTISEMKEMGTRGISFTGGGEPMLHPDFLEIVKFSKDLGLDVGLITNGSAINSKKVKDLNENLTWIRVSMAGGDALSYQKVQGVDQFQKIINNLKLLNDEKKKLNSKLNIGVRILTTPDNINSLSELHEKFKWSRNKLHSSGTRSIYRRQRRILVFRKKPEYIQTI